jgi:hypothetical protein
MVQVKLEGHYLWVIIEGDLVADEAISKINQWVGRKNEFVGLITDIRKMKESTAVEQKKLEEQRKRNNLGKPNAILGRESAMAIVVDIYIRFTRAEKTRYFTDEKKAKDWLDSCKA